MIIFNPGLMGPIHDIAGALMTPTLPAIAAGTLDLSVIVQPILAAIGP